MKVRIGIGTGTSVMSGDELDRLVDDLEASGFDSLWWSDVLTVPGDDPLAAMAYAAGHARRLKIGTTMVLPGRNPVRLAKQLATLDRLSGGRLLVTFVLGLRRAVELDAMGVGAGSAAGSSTSSFPSCAGCGPRTTWTTRASRGSCTGSPSSPSPLSSRSTSGSGEVLPVRCAGPANWATDGCRRCARRPRQPRAEPSSRASPPRRDGASTPSTSASASATRGRPARAAPAARGRTPWCGRPRVGRGRHARSRARRRGRCAPAHRAIRRRGVLQVRAPARRPPGVVRAGVARAGRRRARPAELTGRASPARGMLLPS